jgi:hypothetical protein
MQLEDVMLSDASKPGSEIKKTSCFLSYMEDRSKKQTYTQK